MSRPFDGFRRDSGRLAHPARDPCRAPMPKRLRGPAGMPVPAAWGADLGSSSWTSGEALRFSHFAWMNSNPCSMLDWYAAKNRPRSPFVRCR